MPALVAAPLTGAATCDLVVVGSLVANFAEYATPDEVSWADEIKPGEGAILRRGLKKIAAFRDDEGKLIERGGLHQLGLHRSLERARAMLGLPVPRLPVRHRRQRAERASGPAAGERRPGRGKRNRVAITQHAGQWRGANAPSCTLPENHYIGRIQT